MLVYKTRVFFVLHTSPPFLPPSVPSEIHPNSSLIPWGPIRQHLEWHPAYDYQDYTLSEPKQPRMRSYH